jgi:hypothetical protein
VIGERFESNGQLVEVVDERLATVYGVKEVEIKGQKRQVPYEAHYTAQTVRVVKRAPAEVVSQ